MIANRFGQRAETDLAVEDLFELRVAARYRIADDDEVDVGGDVFGTVPDERAYPFRRQEVAHRRIDVLVRPLDLEALALQHRRERRHRGAAYAYQMHAPHETADSSMTTRGRSPATTRHWTPNGSVIAGPVVCPEGNPRTTGPGNRLKRSAITERPDISPDGSAQFGNSPMTTADARARRPACASWVTSRSRRYGRSPTSSRNSTYPGGGSNANGVPSDASS